MTVEHEDPEYSPPRSGTLLASYFDLHSADGPLHARSVADVGRKLCSDEPIPAYQSTTLSALRRSIELDAPDLPKVDDPRQMDPSLRTEEWAYLCNRLDAWGTLDGVHRLRVAQVLYKLGFWYTVVSLDMGEADKRLKDDRWRLVRLQECALMKMSGEDEVTVPPRTYEIFAKLARDENSPVPSRISAAVNLVVHHARSDRSEADIRLWGTLAETLVDEASPGTLSPLLVSAYWRGISFVPFFRDDHAEVHRMLDEAEAIGAQGVAELGDDRQLLALENMRLVFMTRARAATAAGDAESAERYHRLLVELDPLDSHGHVLLADFLLEDGRLDAARSHYLEAAELGAPHTGYARTRAAYCALA
jgi:hypothetical protein